MVPQAQATAWCTFFVAAVVISCMGVGRTDAATEIISWEYDQLRPAVAYSDVAGVYLVAWEDHHWGFGTDWDIYGRRVGSDGSAIGGAFGISYSGANHRLAPAVAFNRDLDEFLVVWEYEYSATDHDIYAQRVASNGTLVGGEIAISTASNFESKPAVVYNPANEEYLIVWELRTGSDEFTQHDIYGRRLGGTGIVQGSAFAIDSSLTDQLAPAVAFNRFGNQYLVVYQDKPVSGEFDISGQRVDGNGALAGSKIAISTWQYDQLSPRVAFANSVAEFLVVWEDHHWGFGADWDIYGQRVNIDGTLAGGNFGISWEGTNHRLNPDVAYSLTANEYLVVWEYEYSASDHDVFQRRVAADASLPDTEVAVSNSGAPEMHPAVAANPAGADLVVWEDGRNGATEALDVYAELIQPIPATPTSTATSSATWTFTPMPSASPTLTRTSSPTLTQTSTPTRTTPPTSTASLPPTSTPTRTGTLTYTPTRTGTATSSQTVTPSASPTPSGTPTLTPSRSSTPTATATRTYTATATPSATASSTWTFTPSATTTSTLVPSVTPSATATRTFTATPTGTHTSTPTGSRTSTATPTPSESPTRTPTPSGTPTLTPSRSPTPTASATRTYTATTAPSATPSATWTFTPSATVTSTAVPSVTASATVTRTFTATTTGTHTSTPTGSRTTTATLTPSESPTPSGTPTLTPSVSRTPTASATRSHTATATPSATANSSWTFTPSVTATSTAVPSVTTSATATRTFTAAPTGTHTSTPTGSRTTTATPTASDSPTRTPTPSGTPTLTPSASPTASATAPRTYTATATPLATATSTWTFTPSATVTRTFTATAIGTHTATRTAPPTSTPTRTETATVSPTPSPTSEPASGICTLEDVSPDRGSSHFQTPNESDYASLWGKMLSLGATGVPGAIGPATSWNSLNGDVLVEHLAAADQDGHLMLFYSYIGADWKAVDITEKTGATIAIERPQSWLSFEGSVVFERLAAPAPNGDLLVFSWHSGSDWEVMNVSDATGYKITGPVTSWITASDGVPVEHLAARATNDDLLVFFRWAGGAWGVANVTSITGQKVGGEPEGWKVGTTDAETAEKVAVPAGDGSLLLFTYTPSTDWQVINLTTITGQSVASAADVWFDPIAFFEKLAARAPNGDLVIFYHDPIDSSWHVTDVTLLTGQSIGGPVATWRTKSGVVWYEHIAAAGPNQHVYVFYKPTGGAWGVVDVTNLTGTTITQRPTAWLSPKGAVDIERVAAPSFDGRLYVFSYDPGSDWSIANVSLRAQGRTLYAAAPQAGVWNSRDYGITWSQLTRPQPPPGQEATDTLDAPVVIDLAVSPADPRIVFAATGDDHRDPSRTGLYRSTDAGATWSLVHQFRCGGQVRSVTQVLLAPGRPSTVYAVGGCAIAISANNGAPDSWNDVVPPGVDAFHHVWHVAVSAELPGEVRRAFACGDGILWYSHNSGLDWFQDAGTAAGLPWGFCAPSGIRGHIPGPQALAIDPSNPQRVYLVHPDRANGPSYFVHGDKPPDPVDGTFCNDTTANPYRGCGEGSLWYGDLTSFNPSNPGALSGTWSQLPGPPVYWGAGDSGSAFVQTHATANGYLVFFSDKGTLHVSDGKPTLGGWHRLEGWDASRCYREKRPAQVSDIHSDPHGLYVSSDFDLTLNPGPHHGTVYAYNAELNECLGGRLWYASDGGVYRTDDCGNTWIKTLTGLHTLAAINIAVDVQASSVPALYTGTGDNDDFYSLDGGAIWRDAARQCGDCDAWFSDPGQPGRVLSQQARHKSFDAYTNPTGHPDAGPSGQVTHVPFPDGTGPYVVSWYTAAGYRPVIQTLANEAPLSNGDYVVPQEIAQPAPTPARHVVLRARDSINSGSPWVQAGPDLPTGGQVCDANMCVVLQAAGGHASPTYYVGDTLHLWRWPNTNGATAQWQQIVPGGPGPQRAAVAQRFFANPYDANEIYLVDTDGVRHSTDGGSTWPEDAELDAALTAGGQFRSTCEWTDWNIELPARCILNDLIFDRTSPQTRFALGVAGVFYSGDAVHWFRLLDTRAMPSRPRAAWFDRSTDPNDRSLYIALDGRGIMRCHPIPAAAPSPIPTATPTATATATRTTLGTHTATATYTALPTPTATGGSPIPTPTFTVPPTPTVTRSATNTPTATPSPTVTPLSEEWTFRGVVVRPAGGRKRRLRGVRISLNRSNDPTELGERLASSVTGADGAFSMRILNEPNAEGVYYFLALDDPNYIIADIIPGPSAERVADQWIRYTRPVSGEHSENQIEVNDSGEPPGTIAPDIVAVWNGPAVFIQPAGPINAGGSPLDLYIQGVEITQATQCFAPGAGFTSCTDNSLPLASGRATAVRVYIGHQGGPVASCGASPPSQILLEKVPVALTWFTPISVGGVPGGVGLWGGPSAVQYVDVPCATKLDDPADPAGSLRANAWGSATFIIPNPTGDALVVRATVNDEPKYVESDYTNNGSGFLSAPLEARQPWKVKWLLIDYQPWASKFYPPYTGPRFADAGVVGGVSDLMKDMYPMPVEYSQSATIKDLGPDTRDDPDFLLYSLAFIQMFMSSQPDSLFGWLPRGAEDDAAGTPLLLGYAQISGAAGFGVDHRNAANLPDKMDQALAHEIGHNRGLRHIDTGKELCWPFGTDASIRETGFNVRSQSVLRADQHDLMHSQLLSWLSPYTWMRLAGKPYSKTWAKVGPGCAAASAFESALPEQANMSQPVMLVRGAVYRDGSATIEYPFITAGSPTPDGAPDAPYCLELQSDDGAVLARHCFDLPFVNVETEQPTDTAGFAAALPFDEAATWLVLRHGATILAMRSRSIRPPELQVLYVEAGAPGSNMLSVRWVATAGDQNDTPLRYTVLYSPDAGTSWTPVAVDIDATGIDVDTSSWPGSDEARMRVLVSDGFLTSAGDSYLFSVPRKPPDVWITSPVSATLIQPLDALVLDGHASDLEDGELTGSSVVWTLDNDRVLGTGAPLILPGISAAAGVHDIALTATDHDGMPSTAHVPVNLAAPPSCAGDCNEDTAVSVAELVRGLGVALGRGDLSVCPLLDYNDDERITVDELVRAVNSARTECATRVAQ